MLGGGSAGLGGIGDADVENGFNDTAPAGRRHGRSGRATTTADNGVVAAAAEERGDAALNGEELPAVENQAEDEEGGPVGLAAEQNEGEEGGSAEVEASGGGSDVGGAQDAASKNDEAADPADDASLGGDGAARPMDDDGKHDDGGAGEGDSHKDDEGEQEHAHKRPRVE